jgi:hypothetical protein
VRVVIATRKPVTSDGLVLTLDIDGAASLQMQGDGFIDPSSWLARAFFSSYTITKVAPRRSVALDAHAASLRLNVSSGLDTFGLGFNPTWLNGDLHRIFHWIFEGHFDAEQSVLVGRFGFVRFHRPT